MGSRQRCAIRWEAESRVDWGRMWDPNLGSVGGRTVVRDSVFHDLEHGETTTGAPLIFGTSDPRPSPRPCSWTASSSAIRAPTPPLSPASGALSRPSSPRTSAHRAVDVRLRVDRGHVPRELPRRQLRRRVPQTGTMRQPSQPYHSEKQDILQLDQYLRIKNCRPKKSSTKLDICLSTWY